MKNNNYYRNNKDYIRWKFSKAISLAFENCLALPVVYGSKIVMPILNAVLPKSYKSSPSFQEAMMEFYILTGNVKKIEKYLQTTWLSLSNKRRDQLMNFCLTHYTRAFEETSAPKHSTIDYFKAFGVWPTQKNKKSLLPHTEKVLSLLANSSIINQSVWFPNQKKYNVECDVFSLLYQGNWKDKYACIERVLGVLHTPSIKAAADICYSLINNEYVTLDEDWTPQWSEKRKNMLNKASKMCVDNPQLDHVLQHSDILGMLVQASDDKTCEVLLSKSLCNQKRMNIFFDSFQRRLSYSPELFERVMKTCTKSNIIDLRNKSQNGSSRFKEAFEQYDISQQKQRLQKAIDGVSVASPNSPCLPGDDIENATGVSVVRKRKM